MKRFNKINANPKLQFLIVISFILVFNSCKEKEQFPVEPHIEFIDFTQVKNAQGVDQNGILRFSFTDGDGDIGLGVGDTNSPYNPGSLYYHNFFIKYYEVQKGILKEIPLLMPNNSRIPVITPEGRNKSIKGEIEMVILTNNPYSTYDTIMFDAKIVDRALHESNTIQTNYIVIKKH
ncbi:MAG: hypothetical protein HXX09_01420 [Bacteroidetes bacterium]|nr:hypothetical protein [Bacteroidota bacterium]